MPYLDIIGYVHLTHRYENARNGRCVTAAQLCTLFILPFMFYVLCVKIIIIMFDIKITIMFYTFYHIDYIFHHTKQKENGN